MAASSDRAVRIRRLVEKYLVNPVMRGSLRSGIAPAAFALLETTGRRTGRPRQTPVGNGLDGHTFWLVSEHGQRCAYVKNLVANPRVRVLIRRRWYSGTATLLPDDEPWSRREELDRRNGRMGSFDGKVFRVSATTPCTLRIDLDPPADPDSPAARDR